MSETESIKQILGNNFPGNNLLEANMEDGTPYILPPWRINQIVLLVVRTLSEVEYYSDDFDYRKMIRDKNIKLKKFSAFSQENIEQYKKISLSRWNEGICIIFPDSVTGEQRRMIAYNDSHSDSECMHIVLHEYGHIVMHHTEQSINAEVEATCFAIAMSMFLMIEQIFHAARNFIKTSGKEALVKEIEDVINSREGGDMKK